MAAGVDTPPAATRGGAAPDVPDNSVQAVHCEVQALYHDHVRRCVEFARTLESQASPRTELEEAQSMDTAEPEPEPSPQGAGPDSWLHRQESIQHKRPEVEPPEPTPTVGTAEPRSSQQPNSPIKTTCVIVRPVARAGPDGSAAVLAHANVQLINTRITEINGVEWSPSAGEKLCLQPLLAPYHSDGSPEQELSRNNPASLLKVIELAEITIAEAGLTLSAGRDGDGKLEPLAKSTANQEDDIAVLRELIEGLDAPFRIDWHEDAVIVTVAVVKPKCLDLFGNLPERGRRFKDSPKGEPTPPPFYFSNHIVLSYLCFFRTNV